MPHLRILTNVEKAKFDDEFLKQLTKDMAVANEKPEKFLMISVCAGEMMSMGGTTEPVAHVSYKSIGKIDVTYNTRYSNVLFKALAEKGIPADRVYLEFQEVHGDNVASQGILFSQK